MNFDRPTLDRLFRYCRALCDHPDDAYDLLYSAIEKYLQSSSAHIDNPVAYVRRTARNLFFDQRRRAGVVHFEPLDEAGGYTNAELSLEQLVVDQMTLREAWHRLQPAEREVLYLWAMEDMTAAEIAASLEQPRSTVLARLRRVRQRFAEPATPKLSGATHD